VNSRWEWIADIILGLAWAAVLLLAFFHRISPLAAAILTCSIFGFVYFIFPYITPFELVEEAKEHADTTH
jgi:hypothetical protein